MKHATYEFILRAKLTHTQSLSLGPKAPSIFMILLAIPLIL